MYEIYGHAIIIHNHVEEGPKLCLSLKYLHCNLCRTEDPPNHKKKQQFEFSGINVQSKNEGSR